MAKFLMKVLPEKSVLLSRLEAIYPESNPHCLFTHVWMRHGSSLIEEAVEGYLARHEISSGRFLTLMILEVQEKGLMPSELANSLGVTQATVSGLIRGLEESGHIKRLDHASDGRSCVVTLTEKGRRFMTEVRPEFNRWLDRIYSELSFDEREQLSSILDKLSQSIKRHFPSPA